MEHKLMTEREKADIFMEAHRLRINGYDKEATAVLHKIPIPANLAKIIKEQVGIDYLIQNGWNLAEAEAEFGNGWIATR